MEQAVAALLTETKTDEDEASKAHCRTDGEVEVRTANRDGNVGCDTVHGVSCVMLDTEVAKLRLENVLFSFRALLRFRSWDAMAAKRYPRTASCTDGLVVKKCGLIAFLSSTSAIYERGRKHRQNYVNNDIDRMMPINLTENFLGLDHTFELCQCHIDEVRQPSDALLHSDDLDEAAGQ